jgi:hypothetical protein
VTHHYREFKEHGPESPMIPGRQTFFEGVQDAYGPIERPSVGGFPLEAPETIGNLRELLE